MGDKSLYGVLELSRDASAEVIDAAYRSMRAKLEPLALQGNEAALAKLTAAKEAFRVLADPAAKGRYDLSLRRREVPAAPAAAVADDEPGLGRFLIPAIVVAALAGSGGYYLHQHKAAKARLVQELREKEAALARAEAQRLEREDADAAAAAERRRRMDEAQYQQWRDQARRDGAMIQRRNEVERQRVEREEARQRQAAEAAERRAQYDQQLADTAARRRLEEEKARLRRLQYENSR